MTDARWVELSGADNVRDLGGLPTTDGRAVQPARLLRADSLQTLTEDDIRLLVDDLRVRAVADLRSGIEVSGEGPGPLTDEPSIADFAILGWAWRHPRHKVDLAEYPHVKRWYDTMMARPGVQRGFAAKMS